MIIKTRRDYLISDNFDEHVERSCSRKSLGDRCQPKMDNRSVDQAAVDAISVIKVELKKNSQLNQIQTHVFNLFPVYSCDCSPCHLWPRDARLVEKLLCEAGGGHQETKRDCAGDDYYYHYYYCHCEAGDKHQEAKRDCLEMMVN